MAPISLGNTSNAGIHDRKNSTACQTDWQILLQMPISVSRGREMQGQRPSSTQRVNWKVQHVQIMTQQRLMQQVWENARGNLRARCENSPPTTWLHRQRQFYFSRHKFYKHRILLNARNELKEHKNENHLSAADVVKCFLYLVTCLSPCYGIITERGISHYIIWQRERL
jgi:hypothetical protein